ncbi:hypothetical protein KY289_000494 [Solanum tuberosum]|nr:hypothetical protein KY289_000494 [Solanum tuberosum]
MSNSLYLNIIAMALGVCLQLLCLLPFLFSNNGCDEVSRSYLEFFLKKFTAEVEPNDKVVLNNCKVLVSVFIGCDTCFVLKNKLI